jgi:hypothetical protein
VQSIPTKVDKDVVKKDVVEETDKHQSQSGGGEVTSSADFLICRVQLNGPPYYHKHHWDTVIIPRLHVFNDMIALLRKDDTLRYSYLLASEEEKLGIVASLCPYVSF